MTTRDSSSTLLGMVLLIVWLNAKTVNPRAMKERKYYEQMNSGILFNNQIAMYGYGECLGNTIYRCEVAPHTNLAGIVFLWGLFIMAHESGPLVP